MKKIIIAVVLFVALFQSATLMAQDLLKSTDLSTLKVDSMISNTPYIDIIESTPRNTAAAIAFAAFASHPDDVLIVTPSDHIIGEMENLRRQRAAEGR